MTIFDADGLPDTTVDKPGANMRGGGHHYTDHQYGFPGLTTRMDPTRFSRSPSIRSRMAASGARCPSRESPTGSHGARVPVANFISDVEIRYALERNRPGLYTYSIFEHQPDYPASVLGEARFCVKLNDFFDWLTVGPKYNKPYPKAPPREHKKISTISQRINSRTLLSAGPARPRRTSDSGSQNPSVEYLSSGPTKGWDFTGHRDTNEVQAPTVLELFGAAATMAERWSTWRRASIGPR